MNPPSLKRNFALVAMILLLAGGFTRLIIVVSHRPMFGFANNYDFIKISSTVGLWVDEPGVDPYESHPSAPLRHFRSHAARELERRYLSSELLAIFAAIPVADIWNWIVTNPPHSFDLRILGITKAVMFLAVGTGLGLLFFQRSSAMGVVSAMIFAVLICDPINSLYFNTLYFEDAALLFSYAAVGLGVYLVLNGRSRVGLLAAFCTALFLAAFSKMPHAGLALALALAFCIARLGALRSQSRRRAGKELAVVLFTGLLSLWLGIVHNRSPSLQSMVFAAATDSWFGMALPALKNPSATVRSLNLPPACDELVGKNWYTPGMHPHRCPEVLGLTRLQMISVLLQQPKALARVLVTAIPLTRPFSPFYGEIEGENFGKVKNAGLAFASLGGVFEQLALPFYSALYPLSMAAALIAVFLLLAGEQAASVSLSLFLTAVWTSSFLAALLGDGYVDLARHFHIGQNALVLAALCSLVAMARGVQRLRGAIGHLRAKRVGRTDANRTNPTDSHLLGEKSSLRRSDDQGDQG